MITTIEISLEEMGKSLFIQAGNGKMTYMEMPVKLIERGTA